MYATLFLVGFLGFLAMAGMSFLHSGGDARTGNHGSTGEALGSLKGLRHARVHKGHHGKGLRFRPWWALSPFDLLAYATGAGAAGEILRQNGLAPNVQLIGAILGALVFNFGIARPVLDALLKFESRQSDGLEGQVAREARAETRFDAQGRGLVSLALDGQIVQVLASLDRDERERGTTVARGDTLLVLDVDAARNTCRVTRELAP